jgi:hypothetical protein
MTNTGGFGPKRNPACRLQQLAGFFDATFGILAPKATISRSAGSRLP